jgi:hypothetical protein
VRLENFACFFTDNDFGSCFLQQIKIAGQARRRNADYVGLEETSKVLCFSEGIVFKFGGSIPRTAFDGLSIQIILNFFYPDLM